MIALITARGGSKGLPRKNVLPFCGKPLIAHTIEAALRSRQIDRVVVSTDDDEIATVSREAGAEVPFMRPVELASDTAGSREVLLHALQFLRAQGEMPESFCLLQPTSPLRTATDIDDAAELFQCRQADSVLSVSAYEHPIQWAVEMSTDGRMLPRESGMTVRRQELVEFYRPNGAIYLFRSEFFLNSPVYLGTNSYGYIMPPERSVDIDTPLDFVVAETIARYLEKRVNG